jgi:ribonuclease HI
MYKIKIFTDGGSRGNPGPAACGAIFYDDRGELIDGFTKDLGNATNNQAEYEAVILALEMVLKKYLGANVDIFLDSELICEQLKGNYKVKNAGLGPLFIKVHNLTIKVGQVSFNYIPREKNKKADKLVNDVLDGKIKNIGAK